MNRLAYPLAILATCAAFNAQAGDNPPPALLAKIQIATQAHQNTGSATPQTRQREFKDMKKFARENEPLDSTPAAQAGKAAAAADKTRRARDGGNGGVSAKKVGSLDVSKLNRSDPRSPGAIGQGIGGHANDGGRD